MGRKKSYERILTVVAAIFLIGTSMMMIFLIDPHQGFGDTFAPGEIRANIILEQGHIQDPAVPEGLLILGAGRPAVLKFEVFNMDPNNDIDTIEVTIPGSEIVSGSYEWFQSTVDHEWTNDISGQDTITFVAQDDFTGSEAGDSPYYDTSGNVDDALDFIEDFNDGDNPLYDLSEGITLTISFNTPSGSGFKIGGDSIELRVGDLKTEIPGAPLTSFDPFPYPYVVVDNDESILIIELDPSSCYLEVSYGDDLLFSNTRGGDFRTSQYGFQYMTETGTTVAVLEDPGDVPVKPLVSAKEDGLTGQFVLNMYTLRITDIETGSVVKTSIVSNYEEDVPNVMGVIVDNDLDNDGILNNEDDDMDGDDIPNSEDKFPKTFNRLPVVMGKSQNTTVKENDIFTLMVEATDPEMEDLTFTWTNDRDPDWFASGDSVDLSGFTPGEYIFYVEISDELGNSKVESVKVNILKNLSPLISGVSADRNDITIGEKVTLSVNASDPENEGLIYRWTDDIDPEWVGTGNPITVEGLLKGDHTFTVIVSDGWSNSTGTVKVTVKEEEKGFIWVPIIIIVLIITFVLSVVLFLILRKKGKGETRSELVSNTKNEMGVSPEDSYENFYDPDNPEHSVEDNAANAPLEFYPTEPSSFIQAETHEGSMTIEYPQDPSSVTLPGPVTITPPLPEAVPIGQPPAASLKLRKNADGDDLSVRSDIPPVPELSNPSPSPQDGRKTP